LVRRPTGTRDAFRSGRGVDYAVLRVCPPGDAAAAAAAGNALADLLVRSSLVAVLDVLRRESAKVQLGAARYRGDRQVTNRRQFDRRHGRRATAR
jgi:hypothetical protein